MDSNNALQKLIESLDTPAPPKDNYPLYEGHPATPAQKSYIEHLWHEARKRGVHETTKIMREFGYADWWMSRHAADLLIQYLIKVTTR